MWRLLVLGLPLVAGCLFSDECKIFQGPEVEFPDIAAVGDRYLVTWMHVEPVNGFPVIERRGAILDASFATVGSLELDNEASTVAFISGPDRALLVGLLNEGTTTIDTPTIMEIRDATGARLVGPVEVPRAQLDGGVFDGTAFVLANSTESVYGTALVRIGLDGQVSYVTAPGPGLGVDAIAMTRTNGWVVFRDPTGRISVARFAPGGGFIEAPRVIADAMGYTAIAGRPDEAMVLMQGREDLILRWTALRDNGTIDGPHTLGEEDLPRMIVPDATGYTVIAGGNDGRRFRLAPDGTTSAAPDLWDVTVGAVRRTPAPSGSVLAYDNWALYPEVPSIRVLPLDDAGNAGTETVVAATDGGWVTGECGGDD